MSPFTSRQSTPSQLPQNIHKSGLQPSNAPIICSITLIFTSSRSNSSHASYNSITKSAYSSPVIELLNGFPERSSSELGSMSKLFTPCDNIKSKSLEALPRLGLVTTAKPPEPLP